MSVNLNPNRNLAFGNRSEDKGSAIPPVAAGLALGAGTGALMAKFSDPSGQIDNFTADKFTSSALKQKMELKGDNALNSNQKRTAKATLKAYKKALGTFREGQKSAKQEGAEALKNFRAQRGKNLGKIKGNMINMLKEGSKPVGKFAAIGAAIGAAVLLGGHYIFGKSSSSAAGNLKPISSGELTHS
jgi:hypothetical protein